MSAARDPANEVATALPPPVVWQEVVGGTNLADRQPPRPWVVFSVATVAVCYCFVELPSAATALKPNSLMPVDLGSSTLGNVPYGTSARGPASILITQIREQINAGRLARAVDSVYDAVDELLLAGSFSDATDLIRAIIQRQLPLPILLSILTISLPWRERLGPVRSEVVEAVRSRALEEGVEQKVAAVLHGLT